MSFLTENPSLMLETLAVLVRRSGGSVRISKEEAPGPFNLMSRVTDDGLDLVLEEGDAALAVLNSPESTENPN